MSLPQLSRKDKELLEEAKANRDRLDAMIRAYEGDKDRDKDKGSASGSQRRKQSPSPKRGGGSKVLEHCFVVSLYSCSFCIVLIEVTTLKPLPSF